MSKLYNVQTEWTKLDPVVATLAKQKRLVRPQPSPPFIENPTVPEKNWKSLSATSHVNVFLFEVGPHDYPLQDNQEVGVDAVHETLTGAWGACQSFAYIKYARSSLADSWSIRMMGVAYAAKIRVKPASEFNDIADFGTQYERLETEFDGDIRRFARSLPVDHAYRKFGTLEGVLFHELLHFKLAQIDGSFRYEDLRGAMHGPTNKFDSADAAVDALKDKVDQIWDGWRGWITYKPSYNDHHYINEEEAKYYVRQYKKTL